MPLSIRSKRAAAACVSRRVLLKAGLACLSPAGATSASGDERGKNRPDLSRLWRRGENPDPIRLEREDPWLIGSLRSGEGLPYRARQRLDFTSGTAICVDPRPMELFLFSGQSNAGGSPNPDGDRRNATPFFERPWFPNHAFETAGGFTSYGEERPQESLVTDFMPVKEAPAFGVFPQTTFMLALEALQRAERRLGPGYAARTDWFGDSALEAFVDGTAQFRNTLASARMLRAIPPAYGRSSSIAALVFIQGETPGAARNSAYASALNRHFASLRNALAQPGGYRPPILYLQTNQGSAYPQPNGNELAQLSCHRAGGEAQFLAAPMYQFPLVVQGRPDAPLAIHQSIIGKMMLGETLALAYQQITRTGSFDPLRPIKATLQDRTLTLRFDVPAGSSLSLDGDWMPGPTPDKAGLVVTEAAGTIEIEAIRVEKPDQIALRLGKAPAGDRISVRYALDPDLSMLRGARIGDQRFAPSTGRIMAETDIASPFAARGFAVPKRIRHCCVRFAMEVD